MNLSEDDLREIFGLFTSCSRYERNQIYSSGLHDYKTVNLLEEYDLSQGETRILARRLAINNLLPSPSRIPVTERWHRYWARFR